MLVGTLDEGRGRIVVVGDSGTGLKPSIRFVGTAAVVIGFKRIDGGVGVGSAGFRDVLRAEVEVDVLAGDAAELDALG